MSAPNTSNFPPTEVPLDYLRDKAFAIRRHCMDMSMGKGEGYIGQALGISDMLAALYFFEMRHDPANPEWPDRDRFLMSTGHYSSALWAVLAEIGVIPTDELSTYGLNGSRLQMTTLDTTPGVEVVGGSLGQGLGVGVGVALGLRLDGRTSRVFVEISDGELQEGSTWEAAIAATTFKLDNLVMLVDCNGIQADGLIFVNIEPVANKWRSFGWDTCEIDGNDMGALCNALIRARPKDGKPKAIIMRTVPGKGVPTLENRERKHFLRVADNEWALLSAELDGGRHG
jgi:transketolase